MKAFFTKLIISLCICSFATGCVGYIWESLGRSIHAVPIWLWFLVTPAVVLMGLWVIAIWAEP